MPPDLARAISASSRASTSWANMSYSHRKEFVDWILAAKRPKTRESRVARAASTITAGKSRR